MGQYPAFELIYGPKANTAVRLKEYRFQRARDFHGPYTLSNILGHMKSEHYAEITGTENTDENIWYVVNCSICTTFGNRSGSRPALVPREVEMDDVGDLAVRVAQEKREERARELEGLLWSECGLNIEKKDAKAKFETMKKACAYLEELVSLIPPPPVVARELETEDDDTGELGEKEREEKPREFPSNPNNMSEEDRAYFFYEDEIGLLKVKPEFRLPSTETGDNYFHVKVSTYKKQAQCDGVREAFVFEEDF